MKNIETPEIMWQYFLSYVGETKNNPILVHDFVGKDADEVSRQKERPLTMVGFLSYLEEQDIITDATDYFENKDERYSNYVRICTRIRRNITKDQIEGGMAGIYNTSITQRLNSLVERSETKTTGTTVIINEQPHNSANEPIKDKL